MILHAVNEIGAEAVFLYENTNIILLLLRLIYLSDSVQCGEIKKHPANPYEYWVCEVFHVMVWRTCRPLASYPAETVIR